MQKVVRLGYVGAGFMAQKVHLPNFTNLPGCQVIALAEAKPKLGEMVAKRFGISKVYRHYTQNSSPTQKLTLLWFPQLVVWWRESFAGWHNYGLYSPLVRGTPLKARLQRYHSN